MSDPGAHESRVYSDAEIKARLEDILAKWYLDDGHICRRYKTSGWKSSLMVVNAVGHLAEAAFHHPDLEVSYPQVVVRLTTHDAGGVTDKDFELARKLEELVQWQPGEEGGALEGTPKEPRFEYIMYD